MGRPVNKKHFGNSNPHSIKVTAWTAGETSGGAAGYIKRQNSDRSFVCFTANVGAQIVGQDYTNATMCTLSNVITAQGQATLRCFPYGADGSTAGTGATANAYVGLNAANVYTDAYGVTYGGTGYNVNDVLSFNIGTNNQIGNLTVSKVSGTGSVVSATVANTGIYTALPTTPGNINVFTQTGVSANCLGVGAQFAVSFGVSNVVVTAGGTGYTTGNVLIDFAPVADEDFGTDATATAVIGNATIGNISSVTVNTTGSGYYTIPTVEVINTTTGAFEYVARLSERRVITFGGNCYRWYSAGHPITNVGNVLTQCNLDTL